MRYERQIDYLGSDGQQRLSDATVAIAGCGGLATTVITQLAVAGVGHMRIIDFDTVTDSNYNRQFVYCGKQGRKVELMGEWIASLNDVDVTVFNGRLDDSNVDAFLKGADIVVDCFDNNQSRSLLNRYAVKNRIPLVHGGCNRMYGQVTTVIPGRTPCLECLLTKGDGDRQVVGAAVSAIASVQASEVIKYITGKGRLLEGRLLTMDLENGEFTTIDIKRRKDCPVCDQTFSST